MAYLPAALCGYWSLGDRTSLVAFWFPAMLWMLTILDDTAPGATPDTSGIVLLGALAVAFLVFLRVRESRRVELWRTTGAALLARPDTAEVLEEPPGRPVARAGVALALTAAAFAATAWLAPKLWHTESFTGPQVTVVDSDPTDGLPCCPRAHDYSTHRARVSEYLDLGRGHDELAEELLEQGCRVCPTRGSYLAAYPTTEPVTPVAPIAPPVIAGDTVVDEVALAPAADPPLAEPRYVVPEAEPQVPIQPAPPVIEAPPPPPQAAEPAPEPVVTPPPAPVVEPPPAIAHRPPPIAALPPAAEPPPDDATPAPAHPVAAASAAPLAWLSALLGIALASQLLVLLVRPLRRLVTLRHLRRPLWAETVDQRVSNAWQLALVGLRDAGLRNTRLETPNELARRVQVDGLDRCATILDRTRHGIGIDATDLDDMVASADTAYRTARRRVGRLARTIGWLRWPLV